MATARETGQMATNLFARLQNMAQRLNNIEQGAATRGDIESLTFDYKLAKPWFASLVNERTQRQNVVDFMFNDEGLPTDLALSGQQIRQAFRALMAEFASLQSSGALSLDLARIVEEDENGDPRITDAEPDLSTLLTDHPSLAPLVDDLQAVLLNRFGVS